MSTIEAIKTLRNETGLGLQKLNEALAASNGDLDKARQWLRANAKAKIEDQTDPAAQGRVATYAHHNGTVAAMVLLACQTDFMARSAEFVQLANDIALHVVAARPRFVSIESIPADVLAAERAVLTQRTIAENIPEARREQVVTGRLRAFYTDTVLLEQPFVKDSSKTIGQMVKELSAKTGEPIVVKRFERVEVGR